MNGRTMRERDREMRIAEFVIRLLQIFSDESFGIHLSFDCRFRFVWCCVAYRHSVIWRTFRSRYYHHYLYLYCYFAMQVRQVRRQEFIFLDLSNLCSFLFFFFVEKSARAITITGSSRSDRIRW